jgi:hypothetical protein
MSYGVRSWASGLALALWATAAWAEPSPSDRATARVLAEEAGEALDQKSYEIAADKFGRADALVHAPTLLLGLARAQVGLHKLVEAQENYQRIVREGIAPGAPPAFAKAMQDAQRELKAIAPKLAWVTVTLKEPGAGVVTVDGIELPKAAMGVKRAFNPGAHVFKAAADGYNPGATSIEVKEGETMAVSLVLEPLPASASAALTAPAVLPGDSGQPVASADASEPASAGASRQRMFGWIGLGVGAAGLVVGGVTGLVAMGRHSTLESECPTGKCHPPSGQDTINDFRSMAAVSTVGFIVGGLAAAGGAALLLTAPHPTQTGRVEPYIGLTSVGARVTF